MTVALLHVFSFHLLCYSGIYSLWCYNYSPVWIVWFSSVKMVSMCLKKPKLQHISKKFPQRCLWNGSSVHLIDNGPLSSFQGRLSSAYSFRSSKKQATCDGCCAHQSICSIICLHSGMSRAVHPQKFLKVDITINMCSVGFPFHFSLFIASSLNLWGLSHVWSVTPCGNPLEGMGDCFHLHCQAGGWDGIGCTIFMDGSCTFLASEAPPWLVFGDWAISVPCDTLWFLNEKLHLWLCSACWPFSTALSQVFWQECLTEILESVWVPFPLLGLLWTGVVGAFCLIIQVVVVGCCFWPQDVLLLCWWTFFFFFPPAFCMGGKNHFVILVCSFLASVPLVFWPSFVFSVPSVNLLYFEFFCSVSMS